MCKVLNHETPDRVPTFEYAIDPKVVNGICPGGEYADVVEALELDAITAWEAFGGGYAKGLPSRKPGEIFQDEWGVRREWSGEMSGFPLEDEVVIESETDLANYTPPDPLAEHRFAILREYIERFKGDKLVSFNIGDMFGITSKIMGFTNFLLASIERVDLLKAVFEMATEWVIEVARKAIDIGADMIIDNADVAFKTGPFLSPRVMEEIHVPCLKRVTDAVKSRRAYMFNHTHGNIWNLLEMLIDTGIDVIHPLAPEGLMNISTVKSIFGTRVVVAGNISTDLLSRASTDEVAKVTRETIENTKGSSGYILMASSSIFSGVKPENYRTMVETCRLVGRY